MLDPYHKLVRTYAGTLYIPYYQLENSQLLKLVFFQVDQDLPRQTEKIGFS